MMNEIKLTKTQDIHGFEEPLKGVLVKLYQGKGYKMLMGILINSIMAEKKYTFLFDLRSFESLINQDTNLKKVHFKLLNDIYRHFIKTAENAHFVSILKEIKDKSGTYVMSLTHPSLMKFLEKEVGKEALSSQKTYVLQLVEATIGFYQNSDQLERDQGKEEETTEIEVPIDPLFEARKKAIKLGLVQGNAGDEIRELENSLVKEKIRYRTLLDRAKEEDDKRINFEEGEETTPDEIEEHYRVTKLAVEAGIQASRQRKLLSEIEAQLLELKNIDSRKKPQQSGEKGVKTPQKRPAPDLSI